MNWDQTVERVRGVAEFCVRASLERFRVDEDDLTIEVRRSAGRSGSLEAPRDPVAAAHEAHAQNGAASHEDDRSAVLKAEFVGIVRLSRPAVAEGSNVTAERELAYVEALGIRNPIRASSPGRVAAVFVSDGEPVEYGQPLFAIEAEA